MNQSKQISDFLATILVNDLTNSFVTQLVSTSKIQIFSSHYNYWIIKKYLLKLKIVTYQIQP